MGKEAKFVASWVLANVSVTPNSCGKSPQVGVSRTRVGFHQVGSIAEQIGGNGEGTGVDESWPVFLMTKDDHSRGT